MKHLVVVFAVLLFFSCGKDDNNNSSATFQAVNTNVIGIVVDNNNNPVEGATVVLNTSTELTDEFGTFSFDTQQLNGKGQLITVSKSGYYEIGKLFNSSADAASSLSIELIPRNLTSTINAASGGVITTNGGASVSIPPNAIVDASGTNYAGQVQVYAHWLDPSNLKTLEQMPGDLRGMNESGEQVQLVTYGMLAVELNAPNGDKLNLGNDQMAELNFPVPGSLLADAPDDIPLWSYAEDTGNWMEEGIASLNGNTYVGNVGHFSFWNCDAPFPVVDFEICVVDEESVPLEGLKIGLIRDNAIVRAGQTNSNGNITGKIPANESLILQVYDLQCPNNLLDSWAIGPVSEEGKETVTYVPDPTIKKLTISASFIDCEQAPVSNGFLVIDSRLFPLEENGTITTSIYSCFDQINFYALNNDNMQTTELFNYDLSDEVNTIEILNGQLCGQQLLERFIDAEFQGESYLWVDDQTLTLQLANMNNSLQIRADNSTPPYVNLVFDINNGSLETRSCNIGFIDEDQMVYQSVSLSNSTINFTSFGEVGEFLSGSFEGDLILNGIQTNPQEKITGNFRVLREF